MEFILGLGIGIIFIASIGKFLLPWLNGAPIKIDGKLIQDEGWIIFK